MICAIRAAAPIGPVNAYQDGLLRDLRKLRAKVFAYDLHAGAEFARDSAAGFRDSGWGGMASACFALTLVFANVPGGYDIYAAARDLAVAMADQVGRAAESGETVAEAFAVEGAA